MPFRGGVCHDQGAADGLGLPPPIHPPQGPLLQTDPPGAFVREAFPEQHWPVAVPFLREASGQQQGACGARQSPSPSPVQDRPHRELTARPRPRIPTELTPQPSWVHIQGATLASICWSLFIFQANPVPRSSATEST